MVLAFGMLVSTMGDSGCTCSSDDTELTDLDAAPPAPEEPRADVAPVEQWKTQVSDTGREAAARIFRPPI
jgi:hypothetical protein